MHCIAGVLLVLGSFHGLAFGQDPPQGLTPLHLMKLRVVQSVHPNPSGSLIAFVRSEPRLAGDEAGAAYASLYVVPASGGAERQLVGGKRNVTDVEWKPDGSWITFLDQREGAPHKEVYALPMDGGEAFRVTTTERGVGSYHWRPDGKALAYTMNDAEPESRVNARKQGFQEIVYEEQWQPIALYLYDLESKTSTRLTTEQSVLSFQWSEDGKRICAGMAPRPLVDDRYMFVRLYTVVPEGPSVELLAQNPGKLGGYAWSPSGTSLAYISAADVRDPHAGMLYLVDASTHQIRPLTEGLEGMIQAVQWKDSRTLQLCISEGIHTSLAELDVESMSITRRESGPLAFQSFATSHATLNAAGVVAVAASRDTHPAEVFVWNAGVSAWIRLTISNPWLADIPLGKQEVATFVASDGLRIEGILIHPVKEASLPAPLVVLVHGGPESHYDQGWHTTYGYPGQILSARGYFSWYPNYRSSTGRGVAFAKMDHGDPMGREFQDHLDAIASFRQRRLVDDKRVGILGGSYGGYTAAWAATRHSEAFAAAVSFVPFVDIRSKWYTSDIPWEFYFVHYQETLPHQQLSLLQERSPITYAHLCRTPLLLLGGTSDTRVHPSQPHMLYRAVKMTTKTPVRYVQYPGEGHGNRSNVYQYDLCLRTLQWFDQYLSAGDHRSDPPPPADIDTSEWKN